ncbi:MAG: DUF4199 domain-containing protein [Bacteroidota bacterium]
MTSTTRYGLILAGSQAAIALLLFGLGLDTVDSLSTITGTITTAILAYICYLNLRDFRDLENNGYMTVGEGLKRGFKTSLGGGGSLAVFYYLYYKFINTTFLERLLIREEEKLEEQGLSADQLEQTMGWIEMGFRPEWQAALTFFGIVFFVFVASLILSAFMKKSNPNAPW